MRSIFGCLRAVNGWRLPFTSTYAVPSNKRLTLTLENEWEMNDYQTPWGATGISSFQVQH